MIESRGIHQEFDILSDALPFLEKLLFEEAQQGWEIQDGSGLRFEDNKWIVGLGFRRFSRPSEPDLLTNLEGIIYGEKATVREGPSVEVVSESGTSEGLREGDEGSVSTGGPESEV